MSGASHVERRHVFFFRVNDRETREIKRIDVGTKRYPVSTLKRVAEKAAPLGDATNTKGGAAKKVKA